MNAHPIMKHWADILSLRPEVRASDGSVGELQMSLHKAVYQTVDVPYRKVDYYVDITQPTPNLIGFFGQVARRLGTSGEATALFHLDQGMGGGKSHALVGLYHMASKPEEFFDTDFGRRIKAEAEYAGVEIDFNGSQVITLTADYFSPGRPSETFGPAVNLFERFIHALVEGDLDKYHHYVGMGANKATIQQVLTDVDHPVLILLDELMDYVLALSDATNVASMPSEKAFLNALMDACDDVPRVAFVVVMIRSELDERGYPFQAEDFRDYIAQRLVRNGTTVAVTEAQDFASIIRRRLFEVPGEQELPTMALGSEFVRCAEGPWRESVFDRLGANRGTVGFPERVAGSYPFHPELMRLVREEWAQVQGFQRVRSTVAIFARTALHWVIEHQSGRWAPALIGIGDIPLTVALEQLLSSGLLLGNDRAIQGYRAVASTDVTSTDGTGGRSVGVDTALAANGVSLDQPSPAVRMATVLFCYSLVGRAQGRRGATKTELLAAVFEPTASGSPAFTAAEEVFNALTGDEGLGALEVTTPPNAPARYYLSIKQTLRMYFTAALAVVKPEERDELVWEHAQKLTNRGPFEEVVHVERPVSESAPLESVFEGVDSSSNRLVVLDPRRWTLLNGRDTISRSDIEALLGLGRQALRVDNAASCVVACVNTQRRDVARKRAGEALAWKYVLRQIDDTDDELIDARAKLSEVEGKLKQDVAKAFQHYAYLLRAGGLTIEFRRFDDDSRSSLRGENVWAQLVSDGRATVAGGLAAGYLAALLETFDRDLTLREIVQAFFKNPGFPLVPSTDEIRRAIFDLVNDGWELVDADGNQLDVSSPGQIPINSINQTLRPGVPEAVATARPLDLPAVGLSVGEGRGSGEASPTTDGQTSVSPAVESPITPGPSSDPNAYKRYTVDLANRSITSRESREQVWQLVRELAKILDPANPMNPDHQLINIRLTLNTLEGSQGALEDKSQQVGATFRVEDDDF
ncbi:DUF499 domain-containing protein [Streptomyces krungchingensis]|uniref:DUF499 domain-containing protein n=1 Tax=Streptomyces krungchingensis TaxID=1565034 RepID=UPI003CF8AA8B